MRVLKPACEVFKFPKYKKASDVLVAAKSIIRNERRWVQDSLAVREVVEYADDPVFSYVEQVTCKTKAKEAVAFCAFGAVNFVNGPVERSARAYLRSAAHQLLVDMRRATAMGDLSDDEIFEVNDELGHKKVMLMFSLAIRAARKAGN